MHEPVLCPMPDLWPFWGIAPDFRVIAAALEPLQPFEDGFPVRERAGIANEAPGNRIPSPDFVSRFSRLGLVEGTHDIVCRPETFLVSPVGQGKRGDSFIGPDPVRFDKVETLAQQGKLDLRCRAQPGCDLTQPLREGKTAIAVRESAEEFYGLQEICRGRCTAFLTQLIKDKIRYRLEQHQARWQGHRQVIVPDCCRIDDEVEQGAEPVARQGWLRRSDKIASKIAARRCEVSWLAGEVFKIGHHVAHRAEARRHEAETREEPAIPGRSCFRVDLP